MSSIKNIVFDIGMVLVDFCWMDQMKNLGYSDEKIVYLKDNLIAESIWNELDRGVWTEQEVFRYMRELTAECPEAVDEFFNDMRGIIYSYDKSAEWLKGLKERGYRIYLLTNYPKRMFLLHSGVTQDELAEKSMIRTAKLSNPDYLIGNINLFLEEPVNCQETEKQEHSIASQNIENRKQSGCERIVTVDTDRESRFTFMPYVDGYIVSAYVGYTKPDPAIYQCLMDRYQLNPEECVFLDDKKVNVEAAKKLGMKGIVVSDHAVVVQELESILNQ